METKLPYNGTEGATSSPQSHQRAHHQATNGTAGRRQQSIINYLDDTGDHGATWKDIAHQLKMHHGSATGSLSVLHKTGTIAALKKPRHRCTVYVLPEHVNDRPTRPPYTNRAQYQINQVRQLHQPGPFHCLCGSAHPCPTWEAVRP